MFAKRVSMYLLASVISVAIHVPNAVSQPQDVNCDKQEASPDLRGKCDENVKLNRLDRTITNSTTQGDDESNANGANSANGADTDSADGDHDNGHGNDPDHDDSSNPGKGGGNHGTGNNGGGKGPGK